MFLSIFGKDISPGWFYCSNSQGNFKGNAQIVQNVTFEPLMDLNKTIMEVGNITKAATFKSFLNLSYKNTKLLYFVTVLNKH